ncbi:hypothetical protein HSBAA_35240 [Vreelandella sulfidaeris]|uniref:DUF2788 domain-containing protein n=1 Tax=Vreelandella sulfidaeris TaxID=115553 RepID=A0A455UD29_9GAMM|nr:hypothetical protein HSBAA_35240 [Halomonas sulfidaeris]
MKHITPTDDADTSNGRDYAANLRDLDHTANDWRLNYIYVFYYLGFSQKSNAGKFGTVMLFVVLGAGMLGYVLKVVITWLIEGGGI